MSRFAVVVAVLVTVAVVIITVFVVWFLQRSDACEANGGVMLKTSDGYVCAKVERVDP